MTISGHCLHRIGGDHGESQVPLDSYQRVASEVMIRYRFQDFRAKDFDGELHSVEYVLVCPDQTVLNQITGR
jgi:hypothetical protein